MCGLIGALIFLPEKFDIKPQQIKSDLKYDIGKIIQTSYSRYNTTSFANLLIDKMQENFQCCGASYYIDWEKSLLNNSTRPDIGVGSGLSSFQRLPQQQNYNNQQQAMTQITSFIVPISCCSTRNAEKDYNQCKSAIERHLTNPSDQPIRIPHVNPDGCVDKIYNYLFIVNWWPLNIIGGLAIGLQGLSLIFSFCLCCAINRAIDDEDYDEEK